MAKKPQKSGILRWNMAETLEKTQHVEMGVTEEITVVLEPLCIELNGWGGFLSSGCWRPLRSKKHNVAYLH